MTGVNFVISIMLEKNIGCLLLFIQTACTWYMVGVIWFVQLVHYPLFKAIPAEQAPHYAQLHQRFTTWVVIGPMILAMGLAILLLMIHEFDLLQMGLGGINRATYQIGLWVSLLLEVALWLSTFWVQVPLHRKLLVSYNETVVNKLVETNWLRTVIWTVKSIITLGLIWIVTNL